MASEADTRGQQAQAGIVSEIVKLVPGFTNAAADWAKRATGGLVDFTGTGGRPTLNKKQRAAFVAAGGTISNTHHGASNVRYAIAGKRIGGGAARQVARYSSGAKVPKWGVGYDPKTQRTYVDAAGIRYPAPPKGWKGGVTEWQDIALRRGWAVIPPPRVVSPPAVTPPNLPAVIYGPQSSPNYAPVRAAQDVIRFAIVSQITGLMVEPLLKAELDRKYGRATTRGPRSRAAARKRVASSPWGPPKPTKVSANAAAARPAELELVKITTGRMLEPVQVTAQRMPTAPKTSAPPRSAATVPARSLWSTFSQPFVDRLLSRGYAASPRPVSNVISFSDPLTTPQTGALTSPLGAFAGVPSSPDCTCTKKPGKKGRRKRRTICYEGSYRETATGTRKLRKQEVPCK